jgi:hypothetical protein
MNATSRSIRSTALIAALSFLPTAHACAASVDLGELLAGQQFSFEQQLGSFSDSFSFTVGAPVDFILDFSNLGLGSRASLSVFLNGNEIVGTFGRNLTFAWGPFGSPAPFAPGTAFLVTVSGSDNTLADASYRLGLTAPVPEPASAAMMLAGLVAVGAVARRRLAAR